MFQSNLFSVILLTLFISFTSFVIVVQKYYAKILKIPPSCAYKYTAVVLILEVKLDVYGKWQTAKT